LGSLWRDSEGVQRRSDRGLRMVGRGWEEKREVEKVERADIA